MPNTRFENSQLLKPVGLKPGSPEAMAYLAGLNGDKETLEKISPHKFHVQQAAGKAAVLHHPVFHDKTPIAGGIGQEGAPRVMVTRTHPAAERHN